ncbi:Piso0_002803 [Millerozyma farinosa CBS 7064]|uniref:Piso0_002803 protein n=1 Tax=Pichia sorbitophila (strain ATCC MYA-4447 / BCRC 22081 / CBS 7064 / NBRC 10061 / NRRL Y-12695) TaxID=559304 RepID=G8YDJ8_PICSO|nr:Piso0_002803 [Millerozyma farinosa CBS 7064]
MKHFYTRARNIQPVRFSSTFRHITDTLNELQKSKANEEANHVVKNDSRKQHSRKDLQKHVITPSDLSDHFRHSFYPRPTRAQISATQSIFSQNKVSLEWIVSSYKDIPDIKSQNEIHGSSSMVNTFKVSSSPLPEVLFLGHTNSGKSSLINNLLVNSVENKNHNEFTEHAYVSRRAGYTKTLNAYRIGNKLRLIDTPGYGEFGEKEQGELVIDYICNRKYLRRVFVLIDSRRGFLEPDVNLISFLIDQGVPYDIIFTKADTIVDRYNAKKRSNNSTAGTSSSGKYTSRENSALQANQNIIKYYEKIIGESGIANLTTSPKILLCNSYTSKLVKARYGYKEIRFEILRSCGIIE